MSSLATREQSGSASVRADRAAKADERRNLLLLRVCSTRHRGLAMLRRLSYPPSCTSAPAALTPERQVACSVLFLLDRSLQNLLPGLLHALELNLAGLHVDLQRLCSRSSGVVNPRRPVAAHGL
mgnify:FL=1